MNSYRSTRSIDSAGSGRSREWMEGVQTAKMTLTKCEATCYYLEPEEYDKKVNDICQMEWFDFGFIRARRPCFPNERYEESNQADTDSTDKPKTEHKYNTCQKCASVETVSNKLCECICVNII